MCAKTTGILLIALLAGSLALPSPQSDMSHLFIHADPAARVVGGTPAPQGSVPYALALTQGAVIRSLVCGGSLISARTVLTAAHCIAAVYVSGIGLTSSLQVHAGTHTWSTGGDSYNIERNVTHQRYVPSTIKNDIGILITTTPVVFTDVVRPIALSSDWAEPGFISRVTGWGRISTGGPISALLLELYVHTVEGARCVAEVAEVAAANNILAPAVEPHIELCTFHSPGHGMCNGDSGSALVRVGGAHEQIGIVSWGIPCARGAPDMFVRISAFIDWIDCHMV